MLGKKSFEEQCEKKQEYTHIYTHIFFFKLFFKEKKKKEEKKKASLGSSDAIINHIAPGIKKKQKTKTQQQLNFLSKINQLKPHLF